MTWLREFNVYTVIIRLVLAFILAGLVGYEREKKGHAAGLRTHILVCLGATLTTLTGMFCAEVFRYSSDPMRIGAQVVSGIGFIGAGTILVTRGTHVKGLTTAAGLWSTAAIGLALGAGFYEGALVCTFLISLVITRLKSFDRFLGKKKRYFELYVEVRGTSNVNTVLDAISEKGINTGEADITAPRSGNGDNVGVNIDVFTSKKDNLNEKKISDLVRSIDNVDIVLVGI